MIESIYQILEKIGYTHPLHPPVTHLPAGLIIGAFLFSLVAWIFNRKNLAQTARHCLGLALIMAVPTILLGLGLAVSLWRRLAFRDQIETCPGRHTLALTFFSGCLQRFVRSFYQNCRGFLCALPADGDRSGIFRRGIGLWNQNTCRRRRYKPERRRCTSL